MTDGQRPTRRRTYQVAGLSTLLLGLLAVATNLATNALPTWMREIAGDPTIMWTAAGLLLLATLACAVYEGRLSSADLAAGLTVTNLPARNPSFVGRTALLRQVQKVLVSGPVAVIAVRGLGGVGKSQLVLEFAHRAYASGRYSIVWWIRADTRATLLEDLAELSETLGERRRADREEAASIATTSLSSKNGWLLVFDNARTSDDVRRWLPAGAGAVVITSRNRGWGSLASQVDLAEFRRRESIRYLRRRIGRRRFERSAAVELAGELGDLPLALAQAASYLEVYELTVADFLRRYRDRGVAGQLFANSIDGYPASVATTWLLHYDRLVQEAPASLDLLRVCSFLDTDDIDLDLLGIAGSYAELEPVEGPLVAASLVDRIEGRRLRLHRLVAEATRLHLAAKAEPERVHDWALRVIVLLNDLFPKDLGDQATWQKCAMLSGHVTIAIEHARRYNVTSGPVVELAARYTSYMEISQPSPPAEVAREAASLLRATAEVILESLLRRYERAYLRHVSSALSYISIRGSRAADSYGPELSQIYVQRSLTSGLTGQREPMFELLDKRRSTVLVVLGEPGSGKSTLLRYAAARAAENPRLDRRLPILLDAQYVASSVNSSSLAEIVRRYAHLQLQGPPGWWEKRLKSGQCLVMLDGVDEVVDANGRRRLIEWLERQVAFYPKNQYVVTSRPGLEVARMPHAEVVQLAPFDDAEIASFIDHWFAQRWAAVADVENREPRTRQIQNADHFHSMLMSDPNLRALARSPLMLTMIATVYQFTKIIPSGATELYERFWEMRVKQDRLIGAPAAAWFEPALSGVAAEMMRLGNHYMSREEITTLVANAPELPSEVAPEDLFEEAGRAGLLVEGKENTYRFFHLTFLEYLVARHMRENKVPMDTYVDDPHWRGVLIHRAHFGDTDLIIRACQASGGPHALELANELLLLDRRAGFGRQDRRTPK